MSSILEIKVGVQDPEAYRQFQEEEYQRLVKAAETVRGKTIVHVNSTAKGGGVAELLQSQVPLERGLGLTSHWLVIQPSDPKFFDVTKEIHNLLQGKDGELTSEEHIIYEQESTSLREALAACLTRLTPDIIICHDPQPLAAVAELVTPAQKILRIHPDICQPNPGIMAWLCTRIAKFHHVIVSRADCTAACLPFAATSAIAPAIDPLSVKNQLLSPEDAKKVLRRHGIDITRPIISQISRFDPWKDPVGVIEAYKIAKQKLPALQLVLVGFIEAKDDPEAEVFIARTREAVVGDSDIHVFTDLAQLREVANAEFVRAVQTVSDVILQKSLREGFGLTVTEAMWKGKAVIGGNVGGIKLQIDHQKNGWLVNSTPETAQALIALLQNSYLREQLGQAAHESVRQRFLLPRFVRENLAVYSNVI